MHILLVILTVVMGCGVGWSIGANDAANSMGTAVGARVVTLRTAIVLICVFGFLGAFLQGSHVVKTIGKNIVPLNTLPNGTALLLALTASFAGCAWVVLATYWKMPISTSHSMVGAVAGAGLAVGAPVKWLVLKDVFLCWLLTPVGAAVLGFVLCAIARIVIPLIIPERHERRVISVLIIVGGCYVAYTWGSNDVANAVGVIAGSGVISVNMALVIGGAAIVAGVMTWGYKVIETIGSQIVHLLPLMAFCAQLASAANVHVYSLLGMPVSTSHSIVGAIIGVGLVRGVKMINAAIVREIILCWLVTPLVSGLISFAVLLVLRLARHLVTG